MAPERSRVFVVEDDPDYLDTLADYLKAEGHEVVFTAGSLQSGLEVVDRIKSEDVDVGLFDDRLDETDEKNHDGVQIARAFRSKFPNKPVFSISGQEQSWSDEPTLVKGSGCSTIAKKVTES